MVTRNKAAATHLLISIIIATLIGLAFAFIYFPGYYFTVLDGWHRFLLIIGVDVVLGPLLTLIIFNVKKPKKELLRDVSIIATIQLAALLYGLYVFAQTRPVYTAFNGDVLYIVSANEYFPNALSFAQPPYNTLPKFGPKDVFVKKPSQDKETEERMLLSMGDAYWPELYEPMTDEHKKTLYLAGAPIEKTEPPLPQAQLQQLQSNPPKGITDPKEIRLVMTKSINSSTGFFWAVIRPDGEIVAMLPIVEN